MAMADVDAVDFEPEDEDLMDEDIPMEEAYTAPPPKLRSTITGGGGDFGVGASQHSSKRTKGRGFREEVDRSSRYALKDFESLDSGGGPGPQKSVEGWIILVTGVHEEAQEDDIHEVFAEYGDIRNLHLNLDRRTGFVKGYALIEYESKKEAQAAIDNSNGQELLSHIISVNWAFSQGPLNRRNTKRRSPRQGGQGAHRSRSPSRRRY